MRSVFLKLAAALFIASSFGAAAQAPSQAWLGTIDSGTAISDSTRVIRRMNNGCLAITFPYTLPDNAPATLIAAMECANANGPSADTIDLNSQIVTLTAAFADYTGATGLPQITTAMALQNGTISRSGGNQFRLLSVGSSGNLTLNQVTASNGYGLAPGAMGGGGAIYNLGALNIVGEQFNNNYSALDGGAIHNDGGAVNARYAVFSGNSVNTSLGGVGGGLANSFGVVTLSNVLISGNLGVQGASIYNNNGGTLTLNNSTIAGNSTNDQGGGLRNENTAASVVLNNTIISGNESSLFPATSNLGGSITNNFSLIGGSPAFVAPLDATATAPTTAGNYRLAEFSPAIDAGSNSLVPGIITTDLDGNPRRYDDLGVIDTGVGAPPIVDIGAYERQLDSVPPATLVQPTALTVSEAGETTDTFVVSLNQTPSVNVTIQLTFDTNVVVDTGSGFGASPQTLTLMPANALSGVTVTVRAVDDAIDETSPHAALITTAATSSAQEAFNGLAVADVAVAIADDDTAGIAVIESGGATGVTEGGAGDSYSIVLSSQPTADVTINISFDAAQLGVNGDTDGFISRTFTSSDWDIPQTINVNAVDDTFVEANPHTSVMVQTASSIDALYNVIDPADVTVSIAENDLANIELLGTSAGVNESAGAVSLTTRLDIIGNGTPGGTLMSALTAQVVLTAGTAVQGNDFSLSTISITFPAGTQHNATLPIVVDVVNDRLLEPSETFVVSLNLTAGSGTVSGSSVVTIADNETGVFSFNLASDSTSEAVGNYNGFARLTISGSGIGTTYRIQEPASIALTAVAGTAASPMDFTFDTSTLNVPANAPSPLDLQFNASIINDQVVEGDETFTVSFGDITGLGSLLASGTHLVTITDNDTVTVGFSGVNESIAENAGTYTRKVGLSFTTNPIGGGSIEDALSLSVTFIEGTATEPEDFTLTTTSIDFAAGSNAASRDVVMNIINDSIDEDNEVFTTQLEASGAPSFVVFNNPVLATTILDDDTAGVVITQSAGSTDVTEGGTPDTYTLVLTSEPTSNVSIALNTDAQVTVATSPVVFTPANWFTPQTVTVTAVDDVIVEGPHTGTISHTVTSADAIYNNFTVANIVANITDNDLPTLAINDVSITEGNSGTSTLNFTVTRTGVTASAVGFDFATADDTATAGSDYVTATGTGNIPSGGATASTTVSVTINGDAVFENTERFFVNLSSPTNATISDNQGIGTITNDDTAPTLAINDVSIVEGNSGTQNLVFTVTRTGLTALPAQFTAVTTPGTASAPLDYLAALTGSTSMAAGGASGSTTLSATINGDLTIEPNETFTVDLSAPVNASIADGQGLGTITNDDGEPTFTPASAISTQQGSPSAVATLGSVSDLTDPPSSLTVALISGGTVTGVTPTALTNANGTVTASLAASCTAASGTLRLRVTDSGGLTDTDDVQINVTPNSPPSLAYNAINVSVGNTITQNPTAGLSDNGSVTGISILSVGTFAGSVSVSTSGVLSLSNATPAGTHSITVRATDNCGAQTDAVVQVQVAQASTIKAISSNVNPARFGQSVSLSVQVSGVDPSGSVEFFNGSTSLGTAPLTVSPSGGNNLKLATLTLASLPVGSLNLTASYPGDTNNAASTSQVLAQSVVAADTSVTLSTASNPLNLGSSSFNVSVQALTPGGGVPQGSVTLSAGAANCVASLTAGSGSCSLNFAGAGYAAITASYTPSTSNHNASTGGLAVVVVPTPSSADLRVRIGNGMRNISAGALVRYDIVVENLGTQAAVGRLEVPLSADFASASYSCTSAGSASCGAVGSGSIDTEVSVAPGGVVIYSLLVTAPISPERTITQTARITAKAPTTDPDLSNNDAADADPMGLLSDGYEDASIGE